jgi:tRNA dimethylallyltransferase
MERSRLRRRLSARVEAMVGSGLAAEVSRLLARGYDPSLPAMHGIGYRDFVRVLRGEASTAEAVSAMQRDTMRYARRQWTWFQREPDVQWIDVEEAGGPGGIADILEARLHGKDTTG